MSSACSARSGRSIPFGAVLRDGYVWGRGTRDDKDNLAANLMAMLLIKRSGMALDRDVIFLAESGEEADPAGVGIPFMVSRHFDEIDAEFALAEGGGDVRSRRQLPRSRSRQPRKCRAGSGWSRPARRVTAPFRAWTIR